MKLVIAGLLAAVLLPAAPVLVELFTSEGCSSCPPADALLETLDRTQSVPGATAIVLSEHVDYWNSIGWKDPFSSALFSRRQEAYALRFHNQGPYTPQMVVDGTAEFVGSDVRSAESAIAAAARQEKLAVRVVPSAEGGKVRIEVDAGPGKPRKLSVWMALADNARASIVTAGENRGRRLTHVAVVRSLTQVGTLNGGTFAIDVPVRGGGRVVVFVQEPGNGAVLGAAMRGLGAGDLGLGF